MHVLEDGEKTVPLAVEFQEAMRKCSLFQDLSKDDFIRITEHTVLTEHSSGSVLFSKQQPATEFFLLARGKVKLSLLSFEGAEKVIDIINEGTTFAEAIIFRGMHGYPVNASALTDSKVLRINAKAYIDILKNSPDTCFKVMACLSLRLHWLIIEIDRLSLHNATYRLISYLLENIPEETSTQTEVNLSIPKHVIASRISVTPETFSRTLKRLSQQNLLEVHDTHIIINKPVELRRMISI